jgi:hypothetical protein
MNSQSFKESIEFHIGCIESNLSDIEIILENKTISISRQQFVIYTIQEANQILLKIIKQLNKS